MFTLTGLTEMERARLRYFLLIDEEYAYDGDPFIDREMDLELDLINLVCLLTAVHDAAPSAGGGASKAKTPQVGKSPRPKPAQEEAPAHGGKNVIWTLSTVSGRAKWTSSFTP